MFKVDRNLPRRRFLLWAAVMAIVGLAWLGGVLMAAESTGELFFTILHTNDEHASVIPHSPAVDYHPEIDNPTVGGYARLASAVAGIREEKEAAGEPVLLLSGGDYIGGSPFSWLAPRGFAPELTLKHYIGYDAVIIGNHEYDYGSAVLAGYLQAAGYPLAHEKTVVLASNTIAPPDHPLAELGLYRKTHLIELENGLTVGLFGLIGKDAINVANSPEPVEFADQHETARAMVAELQNRGAQVVIAITHLGVEEDRDLAQAVPGIHVIVGGHCHTALHEPVIENETIIVQSGSLLEYLGRLELAYDPSAGIVRIRNEENGEPYLLSLDDRYPLEPFAAAMIEEFTAELNSLVLRLTNGHFMTILDTVAASAFAVPNTPPLQESPFGNFVTDAMRLVTEEKTGERVDFAIQANGSIRGGINPGSLDHSRGKIAFYDLAELIGLGIGPDGYAGYPIVSVYLTGEEICRALEVAVLLKEMMGDTYFLQFSGLRYDYNPRNAVLLTVPVINQPVPSAVLPGNAGSVVRVERYAGEGRQGTGDEGYVPLKRGDQTLYHLVTDAYIVSFLPMVGEMLPMLNIELKDRDGNPVPEDRLDDLIVRVDGEELKVWQTVVEYAAAQPLNAAGVPEIDLYYAETAGRINPVWSIPLITWPILILLVIVAALFLLIRRAVRRRRRLRRLRREM
ncbi:MAG: 5'-nucleotidase C-terminal domain-containing protein [Bacillota bacterium]